MRCFGSRPALAREQLQPSEALQKGLKDLDGKRGRMWPETFSKLRASSNTSSVTSASASAHTWNLPSPVQACQAKAKSNPSKMNRAQVHENLVILAIHCSGRAEEKTAHRKTGPTNFRIFSPGDPLTLPGHKFFNPKMKKSCKVLSSSPSRMECRTKWNVQVLKLERECRAVQEKFNAT